MKITRVDVEHLPISLWGDFWDAQRTAASASPLSKYAQYADALDSWWWPQALVLVRVVTDAGVSGIGWAEDGVRAASDIVRHHFAPRLLVGADPRQVEALWDQMYRASIPYGRKGAAVEAISAVDIALWDLAGKAAGKPVYELLGGATQPALPAYASFLQPVDMDLFVAEAKDYVAQGYRAMKMRMPGGPRHGGAGVRMNVERVAAVRDAVGPDVEVMADAYMGWDLRFAQRQLRALEPYDLGWIEEPLLPDELSAYAELCRTTRVPVAHGENEFTRYGFQQIIDARAAHVLQPDVHRVGGITEMRRVAMLASAAGLEVVPHAFSAPTVHAMIAAPNCRMLEVLTVPVWAKDRITRTEPVFLGEPTVDRGVVRPNPAAGLGVTINPARVPALSHWNER